MPKVRSSMGGRKVRGPKGGGGHHGIGGFFSNLGGDVVSSVAGLGPGLYHAGGAIYHDLNEPSQLNPFNVGKSQTYKKVAKPIGKSYAQTYGPLFHGNLGQFGHNLYEHPLGPALDLLTVVTLGAGSASKVGLLSRELERVQLRGPAGLVLEGKTLSRNPARRLEQKTAQRALNVLPDQTPVIGQMARFARELRRDPEIEATGLRLRIRDYQHAYARLSKHERIAFSVLARVPTRSLFEGWRAKLPGDAPIRRALDDPKVIAFYEKPTENMLRAHAEADKLGQLSSGILHKLGALTPEAAGERRYLHARLASGAEFVPEHEPGFPLHATGQESLFGAEIGAPTLDARGFGVGAWVRPTDRHNLGRIVSYDPEQGFARVHFYNRGEGTRADVTFRLDEIKPATADELRHSSVPTILRGGKSIEELKAEIAAEGRPQPIYLPDTAVERRVSAGRAGGGRGVPQSPAHKSQGVLFTIGQLALEPDVLGPQFLRAVKFHLYRDLHERLQEHAVHIPLGQGLPPKGYVWIRRAVGPNQRPEHIPYTETTRGEFLHSLEELIPNPEDVGRSPLAGKLTTDVAEEALTSQGYRLAVPEAFAREVAGEFTRSNRVLDVLLTKPTRLWRVLVLNLRPAWLVNNMVGNSLLYAIRNAGPAGLMALLRVIADTKGARLARGLVRDAEARGLLTAEDVARIWPEQAEGTFIGTQLPKGGKVGKAAQVAGLGLAPLDRSSEALLRRAALNTAARKSPEIKARLKAMPKETRSFREAATAELETNPALVREISQKVNDTLGDYFGLSDLERRYIRAVVPFYAWYRAIVTLTLKLPLDYPGRTLLLSKLGQLGDEWSQEQLGPLPSFLRGAIPLGGDRILKTQGVNPYATVLSLARGAGDTRQFQGEVNPYVIALASLFGHKPWESGTPTYRLPYDVGKRVVQGTPQYRLLRPRSTSSLYLDPGFMAELRAYLGIPTRRLNRAEANYQAGQGRWAGRRARAQRWWRSRRCRRTSRS